MLNWLRRLFGAKEPETTPPPPTDLRAVTEDGHAVYAEPCGCRLTVAADQSFASGDFIGCGGGLEHCDETYGRLLNRAMMAAFFNDDDEGGDCRG